MGESSKKKRTAAKSASSKKVSEAAKQIVKKKKAAVKPVVRKTSKKTSGTAAKKVSSPRRKTVKSQVLSSKISAAEAPLPKSQPATIKDRVEETKYSPAPVIQKFLNERGLELPSGYNESRITIMVRDPHWLHSYWEIPDWKIEELKSTMGHMVFSRSKRIVRVYDVTDIKFSGVNANKSFDIEVGGEARNWYINTGEPNRSYCVDIGYLTPEGKFFVAARSNVVSTPPDGMSDTIDEEWLTIDWERIYAMSGGFGIGRSSGEIRELLKRRLREELSSGAVSSWGGSDFKSPLPKEKDFWLVVNTELIVYGATEPDAKVSMQGLPIKLRPDGTFSMRFALPDGRQDIPVVAVNKDGDMRRQITPAVEKRTK